MRGASAPLLSALFVMAQAVLACAEEPLKLEAVIESVERHFPLIEAARRDQQAAAAELMSAQGSFDPAVRVRVDGAPLGYYQNGRFDLLLEAPTPLWGTSVFGGYRVAFGKLPEYDGKLDTNQYGELRAGFAIPLLRNGPTDRRRAGIERAQMGVPLTGAALRQTLIEAVRTATFRYWEWVAAGERLRVMQALLDLAETRDHGMHERVRSGDLARVDRIDNQRSVLSRQSVVVGAARALQAAAIELSIYLRDERGLPLRVEASRLPQELLRPDGQPDEQAPTRIARDTAAALRNRPELERLRLQREQLRVERDLAKNQALPSLDLVAMVSQDFGPGSATRQPTVIEGGLSVDIPTLNRVARGRRQAAEAGMSRLDALSRLAADRIGAEIADSLSAISAARQRVKVVHEEVRVSREVEEAERTRFSLGDSNILFVNLREQATAEAALREIDALLDYNRALAAYRAALAAD